MNFKDYYDRLSDFGKRIDDQLTKVGVAILAEAYLKVILLSFSACCVLAQQYKELPAFLSMYVPVLFTIFCIFLEVRGRGRYLAYSKLVLQEFKTVQNEMFSEASLHLDKGNRYTEIELVDLYNNLRVIENELDIRLRVKA